MKIVIDIPDNYDLSKIQNGSIASKILLNCIKNGTPQQEMGCKGCKYEETGNNTTYPCSHCGRCYTDKYKAESEDKNKTNER